MTPTTKTAPESGAHPGIWNLEEPTGESREIRGLLFVPEPAQERRPDLHAYLKDGQAVYSARLTPDGNGWSGEERRRSPFRFQLMLQAEIHDGRLSVFGDLWTEGDDTEEPGTYVGAFFPLASSGQKRETT